jgi:uncharacterized tellurite resistance protein B-like protein
MLTIETRRLLFEMACTAVVCDGRIDEREIKELHYIDTSTPYFSDIDLSNDIDQFLADYKKSGDELIYRSLQKLKNKNLSPSEQLLTLEIILRIINSDEIIEESEVSFIHAVRETLPINDEIIKDRFGELDILFGQDDSEMTLSSTGIKQAIPKHDADTDFGDMYHGLDWPKK